ncbi:MAG: hypothetical protein GXP38_17805 [Chloroflexi bacterium]|nr:hypothetical protein [Chloroflexota bacterium]
MSVTVAQALKIGGLTQGRLLTRPYNLDNVIEYVDIIEIPYIPDWEAENHLFLTSFYAIKDDIQEQIHTIEILAEKKCAALVFQQGVIEHLPESVIQRADQLGLPLIEVPEEVEYRTIITPLVGAILRDKSFLLQRSQDIHRRLMDLILNGQGLGALAKALSELVHRPVAIVDMWNNIIATPDFEDVDHIRENVRTGTMCLHQNQDWTLHWYSSHGLWLAPILSGHKAVVEGFVVVSDPAKRLDQFDLVAIEQTATIAALDLVKQKAVLETERRLKRDFIEDVLGGEHHSPEAILARARALGWVLTGKQVVMLVDLDSFERNYLAPSQQGEAYYQEIKEQFLYAVSQIVTKHNPLSIIVDRSDSIIVLPHFEEELPPAAARRQVKALSEIIREQAPKRPNDLRISIAIGGFADSLAELSRSYREARMALMVGRKLALEKPVIWYDDVALYVQLDRLVKQPETRRWFEQIIGPLIDYDRNNDTELVKTLEVYFDANQMSQRAAYQLSIHPKTLKYRLRRIEEILGTDPFLGDRQLNFYLATKMAKFLDTNSSAVIPSR